MIIIAEDMASIPFSECNHDDGRTGRSRGLKLVRSFCRSNNTCGIDPQYVNLEQTMEGEGHSDVGRLSLFNYPNAIGLLGVL